MNFVGIIPARYASTRFPGKPLAMIGGMPMIERVYRQASKALDHVCVATDDSRIYECVRSFGGQVVMTRSDHKCGTDRCVEAMHALSCASDDVIINIQGDEPFIQPEQIEALKSCFSDPQTDIATLVKPFLPEDGWDALANPNSPKVVFSSVTHQAILFSRSIIPYLRGIPQDRWLDQRQHYKHIGMYAYRAQVLEQVSRLPQSPMEINESLEQLRWLENGYRITVAVTDTASIGIDTPQDLEKAEAFLAQQTV